MEEVLELWGWGEHREGWCRVFLSSLCPNVTVCPHSFHAEPRGGEERREDLLVHAPQAAAHLVTPGKVASAGVCPLAYTLCEAGGGQHRIPLVGRSTKPSFTPIGPIESPPSLWGAGVGGTKREDHL